MTEKTRQKIYEALVEGAYEGLTDNALYEYVVGRYPKATSKRIVRASLLALSDPAIADPVVLRVIYALAIKHRVASMHQTLPDDAEPDDDNEEAPAIARRKAAS
jgi:hypothetical protein